jgi:hypothetical protein
MRTHSRHAQRLKTQTGRRDAARPARYAVLGPRPFGVPRKHGLTEDPPPVSTYAVDLGARH